MKPSVFYALYQDKQKLFIFVMAILFASGIVFHLFDFTRPVVMKITDTFLLLTNLVVIYFIFKERKNNSIIIWSVFVYVFTFLIEYIGVKTGKVFGNYEYGNTMIIQLGDVPLVIAFNWTILILATYSITGSVLKNRWLTPIISSLLIVLFDFVMEPVAMELNYWNWKNDIIPFQNYAAWFLISLISAYVLSTLKIMPTAKILRYYFLIQFVFFTILRIFLV